MHWGVLNHLCADVEANPETPATAVGLNIVLLSDFVISK